jgi:small-conductance mechanosensitive channel
MSAYRARFLRIVCKGAACAKISNIPDKKNIGERPMEFVSKSFLGNPLWSWLSAVIIFISAYVIVGILGRAILLRLIRHRKEQGRVTNELFEHMVKRTNLTLVFIISLFLASLTLDIPPSVSRFLEILAVIALVLQATLWGLAAIDYWVSQRVKASPGEEAVNATTMGAVSIIAKIALWSVAVLIILQNITQMDLNALLAALGIGGIAVALAVQNILSDLFSSISIAMDKPFILGDDIAVDNFRGTVEYIGLKSTRLRSVSGEQLVFSNSDLLSSRIHNFQRLQRRRVAINVNVAYQTPSEKLLSVPLILQECIETQDQVTFSQAYFKEFGSSALIFECAYFVETPDFIVHRDARQAINYEICQRFAKQGIELAYTGAAALAGSNPPL